MTEEKSIKIKKNDLWKYATFVLLAIVIILGVISFRGGYTGQVISEEEAGENLVNYLSSVGYTDFEVQNIQNLGSIYEIDTTYQGQEIPFYITKDGYIIGNSLVSIIPQKEETSCYKNANCDLELSIELMESVGIDSNAVLECVSTKGDNLFEEDYNTAVSNGVTGSPTLMINGEKVSVSRTADAYKSAVCSAFTNAPKECEGYEDLSLNIIQKETPVAELYIWSYCPYGVTALKPFAEVASLLDDYASFRVYLYYAGHGDFEEQQNKIQACIQNLGYEEEYWEYAQDFVTKIYPSITDSTGSSSAGQC